MVRVNLAQIKFICLADPILWEQNKTNNDSVFDNLKRLNRNSKSWFPYSQDRGRRIGIYKVDELNKKDVIMVRMVAEADVKEEFECAERILSQDNCLPNNIRIPNQIPKAKKAFLYLDLKEGLIYLFGRNSPDNESILSIIENLQKDTHLFLDEPVMFEWQQRFELQITEIARKEGYKAYKSEADLENVVVTATGDLDENEELKKIINLTGIGKWKTLAYRKSEKDKQSTFWISKSRRKQISLELDFLQIEELFDKILEMRTMIEKAIECDIRRYCFPQSKIIGF